MKQSVFVVLMVLSLTAFAVTLAAGGQRSTGDGELVDAVSLGDTDDGSNEITTSEDGTPGRTAPRRAPRVEDMSFRIPPAAALMAVHGKAELLESEVRVGLARPRALAAADFDEDGVDDLVCGYARRRGGLVVLHRGNLDAIFPHTPAARQRRLEGTSTDSPFLSPAQPFAIPTGVDFLGTGDFDNDGHLDLVAAPRGGESLVVLTGDGQGRFREPDIFRLPGRVTALATGELVRADGLADLAVGIVGADGPALLVYRSPEGALNGGLQSLSLPAPADALKLGRLDDDPFPDLAVAAGRQLLIAFGGSDRSERSVQFAERIEVGAVVTSIASGDFVWESARQNEVAVLTEDGAVLVFSPDEQGRRWTELTRRQMPFPEEGSARSHESRGALLAARMTGLPMEDLVVANGPGSAIHVIAGMTRNEESGSDRPSARVSLSGPGLVSTSGLAGRPTAVLPIRLNPDARTDLVLLEEGVATPSVASSQTDATIVVTSSSDDTIAGNGLCTLREALTNANGDTDTTSGDCAAGSGADAIHFDIAGGGSAATIVPTSALPSITDPVTIDGTTQGWPDPPCIELTGTLAGSSVHGVLILGGSSTVRGLAVNSFDADGIRIESDGNLIEGNHVGTDLAGTTDLGNGGSGIPIISGADNAVGGTSAAARNLLSGNHDHGVLVRGSLATGNQVLGNFIGTDVSGAALLGNDMDGVQIDNASGNTIGGTVAGSRNLISGNRNGVYLDTCAGNMVFGNFIGTDEDGDSSLGNTYRGVDVRAGSGHTIGGTAPGARNVISGNDRNGVYLRDGSNDNDILGNYVGVTSAGNADLGNKTAGVESEDGTGNIVGGTSSGSGNVISGNGDAGVVIERGEGNSVVGNLIGTDAAGTVALANALSNVVIFNSSDNTIGGAEPGARNVISGGESWGVRITATDGVSERNQVLGNYIGTDSTGAAALANASGGVSINESADNIVGGTAAGSRNVISGNDGKRVFILAGAGNQVVGNYIGTDVDGTLALGNTVGVRVEDSSDTTIGGETEAARNVISASDLSGVVVTGSSSGTMIVGNYIGTQRDGRSPLGNQRRGIVLGCSDSTVGGTTGGSGNRLAFNQDEGIVVKQNGVGNALLRNSIHSNGLLGIDLGDSDGVTPNDPGDADAGHNNLQNYPVLDQADATPTPDVTVAGLLNSTANTTFRIEFFANPSCDPAGHGEGERYLGFTEETTAGDGDVSFSVLLASPVTDGESITATATDPDDNTSEFSACFTANCAALEPFAETIAASADKSRLAWPTASDIRYAEGDLASVGTYATTDDGWLLGVSSVDISADSPEAGSGFYYVVKPLGCGSWQTALGAEPARDGGLP